MTSAEDRMHGPDTDAGLPPGAVNRVLVAIVPLCVLWALAFTGTTPFYPTIVVGSAAMLGLACWVWASAPDGIRLVADAVDERRRHDDGGREVGGFPQLRLTTRTVWFALVVALVHYLVGAALYVIASRYVPAFADTASATYDRADAAPLWLAVLLGGLVSAPLEEVFWRGAVQPVVTGLLVTRWAAMRSRPLLPIVASAVVYAAFHAATTQLALVAAALLGGLVWGWLLHRTRSLGAVMVAHAAWTCLMLLAPPAAAI